jgi:hypothetical protein
MPQGSWDMSETGSQFMKYQKSLAQHLKDGALSLIDWKWTGEHEIR